MKTEAKNIVAGQQVRFPFGGWQEVREVSRGTYMMTVVTDMAYSIPMNSVVYVK